MEEQLLAYVIGLVGEWGVLGASALGSLIVLAQVVVPLTPSTADDEAWEKVKTIPVLGGLIKALVKLAPIQKK